MLKGDTFAHAALWPHGDRRKHEYSEYTHTQMSIAYRISHSLAQSEIQYLNVRIP